MTTISGKWIFLKNITFSDCTVTVNFISNGELFNCMSFSRTDINLAYGYQVEYSRVSDEDFYSIETYSGSDNKGGSWSVWYQIVDFGEEPQIVPEDFGSIMESNARKMDFVSDKGLKDGSSFVCPIVDPITFIDDALRNLVCFYIRLCDLPEEVIE